MYLISHCTKRSLRRCSQSDKCQINLLSGFAQTQDGDRKISFILTAGTSSDQFYWYTFVCTLYVRSARTTTSNVRGSQLRSIICDAHNLWHQLFQYQYHLRPFIRKLVHWINVVWMWIWVEHLHKNVLIKFIFLFH